MLPGRIENGRQGLLDAEIDDPIAVVGQDDVDQVLADVVDVAAHRGQHDRAFFVALDPLHMRFEKAHRRLHRFGRLQHKGQLHLAGAEQFADRLHPGKQDVVDDVERFPLCQRKVEVGLDPLAIAIDDALRQPVFKLFGARLFRALGGGAVGKQRDEGLQRVIARTTAVEDQVFGNLRLFGRDAVQRHDP